MSVLERTTAISMRDPEGPPHGPLRIARVGPPRPIRAQQKGTNPSNLGAFYHGHPEQRSNRQMATTPTPSDPTSEPFSFGTFIARLVARLVLLSIGISAMFFILARYHPDLQDNDAWFLVAFRPPADSQSNDAVGSHFALDGRQDGDIDILKPTNNYFPWSCSPAKPFVWFSDSALIQQREIQKWSCRQLSPDKRPMPERNRFIHAFLSLVKDSDSPDEVASLGL